MSEDVRQEAYEKLLSIAEKQGYLTLDDIMDIAGESALPLNDVDWLSNSVITRGILVYDEKPHKENIVTADEEYDDFAQFDYNAMFKRIAETEPSLSVFVNEIKNIKPPQARELNRLIYQAQEGNTYARNRIAEMHLRVVLKIALQRAEQFDADLIDCVSDACVGLLTAIDRYDPSANGAFLSYASLWMLQNISREQPTQRPQVYYPVHKKEQYFTMYPILKKEGCVNCKEILECRKVRELICHRLECSNEQTQDVILQVIPLASYEQMIEKMFSPCCDVFQKHNGKDSISHLYDRLKYDATEDTIIYEDLRKTIAHMLNTLKEREAAVLRRRFGFIDGRERTLEEIGNEFGITRERVRQIEAKALRKLRHTSRSKYMRD